MNKRFGERYRFLRRSLSDKHHGEQNRQRYLARLYKALVSFNYTYGLYGKRIGFMHPVLQRSR